MEQYDESSTMSEFLDLPESENDNIEFIKVEEISHSDEEEVRMEDCLSNERRLSTRSKNGNVMGHHKVLKTNQSVKLKEEVVLTLINTLRRTPVLWKQDEPGYRDLGVQQEAWNSVAEQFGVPVDNLKEKWKMLRTQFRANLSKIRSRSMNGADGEPSYQPTWFAFEAMKFLRETPECAMPKTVNIPAKHVTATSSVEDSSGGYPYETDAQEVILELIKEIKQKPVLWDITHPLHKNAAVQFRAWKTLSDRLNLPITDMKRKWQHLRVQFRNNLRKVESMSTPEEVYEPSWFAFEAMQFIRRNYSTDPEKPVVTPELNVKQPIKQAAVPKPSAPVRTPIVKPIVREYKRRHPSPIRTPDKVKRINPCTSTKPPTSIPVPNPESIRPVSYVSSSMVQPFIIRTFRNLSKITDQIAQTRTSPYSGLLDHMGSVLQRKCEKDFKEIEGVLLDCLSELHKFPNASKAVLEDDSEIGDTEQLG